MGAKKFGVKERLLNSTAHRFQLTRPSKVGPTSELLKNCNPKSLAEWEDYYWSHAIAKSKAKTKITPDVIESLGNRLFDKINSVVRPEMEEALRAVTLQDCIDYIRDVTIDRSFTGYLSEQAAIVQLDARFSGRITFTKTDSKTDSALDVDFVGDVLGTTKKIGIQVKPPSTRSQHAGFSREKRVTENFAKFEKANNAKVFIVVVKEKGKKRVIVNPQVIEEIESYIREK